METISQMFQSPAWWVSTIVVALVINLLSNRLSRVIDKWSDGRSEKRQKKLEKEKEVYREGVRSLANDPTDLIFRFILATFGLIIVVVSGGCQLILLYVVSPSSIPSPIKPAILIRGLILMTYHFAVGRSAWRRGRQCIEANELRKKALLEEKENKPATTSTE
jgi:hypothetical protein